MALTELLRGLSLLAWTVSRESKPVHTYVCTSARFWGTTPYHLSSEGSCSVGRSVTWSAQSFPMSSLRGLGLTARSLCVPSTLTSTVISVHTLLTIPGALISIGCAQSSFPKLLSVPLVARVISSPEPTTTLLQQVGIPHQVNIY